MTNSYDVAHGLSQVHPGPEEPVEIAQQDDTLARTGNTARDQEMYAAGIRTGEENTKHNAAIRAGVPDGWRLVPNTMTLDMCVAFAETWFSKVRCIDDPEMQDAYAAMLNAAPTAPDAPLASMARAIFGDQIGAQMDAMASVPSLSSLHGLAPGACEGMKSEDYVNKVRNGGCSFPDCAAPGVSTVEDAGAQKEAVMDAIADALGDAYDCTRVWHAWSYGTMGPDDFALVAADPSRVAEIATAAIAAMRPAPAAGDAQELLGALVEARRELHACQAVIHYAGRYGPAYVRDAQAALKRADAAIVAQHGKGGAAQRKGDA